MGTVTREWVFPGSKTIWRNLINYCNLINVKYALIEEYLIGILKLIESLLIIYNLKQKA